MPRITGVRDAQRAAARQASMRPGRNAPDNVLRGGEVRPDAPASMRPGRNAPDNCFHCVFLG